MCNVLCLPYLRENGVGAALSIVSPVRKKPWACDESSGPCLEEAPLALEGLVEEDGVGNGQHSPFLSWSRREVAQVELHGRH